MNIMMIHLRNIGGVTGGLERVLCQFSNEMAARGHQVSLVIYDDSGEPPYYPLDPKVKLINIHDRRAEPRCIPGMKKLSREWARARGQISAWYETYRDPFILPSLAEVYKECKPDVILNQYYTSSGFVYASKPPCPVINMIHGIPEETFRPASRREWKGFARSALVQVLLPDYVNDVRARLPHTPCICIPNVVPQVGEAADLASHKDRFSIIQVGRLDKKVKRQYLTLAAFSQLAKDFPMWSLHFWGDGNQAYKQELENLVKKYHLQGRAFLEGPTHEVFREYRKSDILAFPSTQEGFGLTLAEGMSAGLPAVGFRSCRACADLVEDGETGFLAADGVDTFAACLSRLMKDKELRARMGWKAHESMKSYAPGKIWDRWERVLNAVAAGETITE